MEPEPDIELKWNTMVPSLDGTPALVSFAFEDENLYQLKRVPLARKDAMDLHTVLVSYQTIGIFAGYTEPIMERSEKGHISNRSEPETMLRAFYEAMLFQKVLLSVSETVCEELQASKPPDAAVDLALSPIHIMAINYSCFAIGLVLDDIANGTLPLFIDSIQLKKAIKRMETLFGKWKDLSKPGASPMDAVVLFPPLDEV